MNERSELVGMREAVNNAITQLVLDRQTQERRIKVATRKMRAWRFAGAVGLVLSVLAIWGAVQADNAVEEIQKQRAEARLASCVKDNENAGKINGLGDALRQIVVLATSSPAPRSPESQARVDFFVTASNEAVDQARIAARDCSPAGIDAFFRTTTTTEAP